MRTLHEAQDAMEVGETSIPFLPQSPLITTLDENIEVKDARN